MKNFILKLLMILIPTIVFSQTDSLLFINGNIVDGEIKSMERGILKIETDYSDTDFKIEWTQIHKIKTTTIFFVTLTDEKRYFGKIRSLDDKRVGVFGGDSLLVVCQLYEIVNLQQLKKSFWDRLYASIDIGFGLAKANDLRQWTSRSSIGYRTERWKTDATFNTLRSTQKEVDPIERSEGKIDYYRLLARRWFSIITISLTSNTEQKLILRMNLQLGMGRFLLRTNQYYWGAKLGVNRNVEDYSGESPDRSSWEGYIGMELNLYDIGDLNLLTNITAYPGITEKKRIRTDINTDIKYDLPYDFYIKIGLTVNYDNRPAEGASKTDYVFQTGFGWEW